MENTQDKKEVINVVKEQQVQKIPKCCPFLNIPVMAINKITQKQEPQLKLNQCIESNCAIYNETIKKCGLAK